MQDCNRISETPSIDKQEQLNRNEKLSENRNIAHPNKTEQTKHKNEK